MNSQDVEWLKGVFHKGKLFSDLSDKEISEVINHMERVNFSSGDVIFKEGDEGDWFFIVLQGKVKVTRKKGWFKDQAIADLGPEDFFGEMALFENEARAATLKAVEDTSCFVLFKNNFKMQTEKHPLFKQEIEKLIGQRKRGSD